MYLRNLLEKDAVGMLEWMHDPDMQKCFRIPFETKDLEEVTEFITNAKIQMDAKKNFHYAIADEKDEYLGTVSLKDINLTHRNAEYAISLRQKARGKGIAVWATREILRIAFEKLGLERVYLNVFSDNERAVRFYEKTGFIYEGESENCLLLRGRYRSLRWYRMLRKEYFNYSERSN